LLVTPAEGWNLNGSDVVVSFSKAIKLAFTKSRPRTIAAIQVPAPGTAAMLVHSPRNLIALDC
jgi:hypothetical protein